MHLGSEKAPGCQLERKMTLGGGWTGDLTPELVLFSTCPWGGLELGHLLTEWTLRSTLPFTHFFYTWGGPG